MTRALSRCLMALALCFMGDQRRGWASAMRAEFDVALAEGGALGFAAGCLATAWRELLTREEGRFTLTSYSLALGLMLPMATIQIGCAVFGLPYLYPGKGGLHGAMTIGGPHEALMRSVYQGAVPPMAFLLLVLGAGHLRIAWSMLERDWAGVLRTGALTLAATVTLTVFMSILFLDCTQALIQTGVLAIELATVAGVARWHADLFPAPA